MRHYKIHKHVISVSAGRKELTDKDQVYPETIFKGNADELVRRGFIYQVEGLEFVKKHNVPERDVKVQQVEKPDGKGQNKGGKAGKKE